MVGIKADHPTKETGLFVRDFSDREILKKISCLPQDRLLVEKTPSHLYVVKRIRTLLPSAKLLLIKRNPLDVVYSLCQRCPFWEGAPKDFEDAVRLYSRFLQAQSQAREFDYELIYEDLWFHPIQTVRQLFAFLGLDTTGVRRIVEKTKRGQSLPASLKAVFRTGTPGQGQQHFSSLEIEAISKVVELSGE